MPPEADSDSGAFASRLVLGFVAFALLSFSLLAWLIQPGDEAEGALLAVFPPLQGERQAMAAIASADGRLMRFAGPRFMVVTSSSVAGYSGRLRREGAVAVYRQFPFGPQLAGCLALATTLPEGL